MKQNDKLKKKHSTSYVTYMTYNSGNVCILSVILPKQGSSTFQIVRATLTISMMSAGHKAMLRHLEL
jgi:hypothetical protein